MKVIVDTCVWSNAFRKKQSSPESIKKLTELVNDNRVIMLGPIRQELLSGIKETSMFEKLKEGLNAFPDLLLDTSDYVKAAEFFNICRSKGIQGSNTDFLICAVAHEHALLIYTTDKDFQHFSKYLPIKLYE